MKRLAVLPAAVLLITACADAPTVPPAEDTAAAVVGAAGPNLSVSSAGQVLNFDGDLDFITSRVLPGFDDAAAAEDLRTKLADIKTALAANDRAEVGRLAALARAELTPGASNQTDLGYIDLVLETIERAIAQ